MLSEHNLKAETMVKGYQGECGYRHVIKYGAVSLNQARQLVEISASCHQHVSWRCHHAPFHSRDNSHVIYLLDHNGQKMNYWGGATGDSGSCACGMTGTCSDPTKSCNCDVSDLVVRTDSGDVTNMTALPISTFCAGGTGEHCVRLGSCRKIDTRAA